MRIRFVAISSIRRGAIEPGEVLEDCDQTAAIEQLRADEGKLGSAIGEIVLWHNGKPYVDMARRRRPARRDEQIPRISAELRAQLRGRAMQAKTAAADYARKRARGA